MPWSSHHGEIWINVEVSSPEPSRWQRVFAFESGFWFSRPVLKMPCFWTQVCSRFSITEFCLNSCSNPVVAASVSAENGYVEGNWHILTVQDWLKHTVLKMVVVALQTCSPAAAWSPKWCVSATVLPWENQLLTCSPSNAERFSAFPQSNVSLCSSFEASWSVLNWLHFHRQNACCYLKVRVFQTILG